MATGPQPGSLVSSEHTDVDGADDGRPVSRCSETLLALSDALFKTPAVERHLRFGPAAAERGRWENNALVLQRSHS